MAAAGGTPVTTSPCESAWKEMLAVIEVQQKQ